MKPVTVFRLFCILVALNTLFKTIQAHSMSAFVSLFYFNSASNSTVSEHCECGRYGLNSPLLSARGLVGVPKSANRQACNANTRFTTTKPPWIALIERGNCSFAEKIQLAARRGAAAAVIYNTQDKGNRTLVMMHLGEYHSVKR